MYAVALLSLCGMMPQVVDDIVTMREDRNISEQQFRSAIRNHPEMPDELKSKALGAVNMVYALPKGSDYYTVKQQIILTCDNKETIRGYQHTPKGPGRGTGSRTGFEQHRGERSRGS